MDMKYWDHYHSDPKVDLEYYIQIYETNLRDIKQEEILRKQFIKKEISKEYFLEKIKSLKNHNHK